ncbi:hypothetical protein BDW02DRAFT_505115, partial [Decorospora gaudefroyi]
PPMQPPSYGTLQYWNTRFTKTPTPFEWLQDASSLDPYLHAALCSTTTQAKPHPNLLHIGCGTSLLSHHLRTHVHSPPQIHNIDYSPVAIQLGKQREHDIYTDQHAADTPASSTMRWSAVDLLNFDAVLRVCNPNSYSVIVDKSTTDAIACSDDIPVSFPYPLTTRHPHTPLDPPPSTKTHSVNPTLLMALHLALVAKEGAQWISLSYASERFSFLDGAADGVGERVGDVFADVGLLWEVRDRWAVEDGGGESGRDGVTHRAKVSNWVYVLRRTGVPVFVRGRRG